MQGNALLIDWKTGRTGGHDDRMQIVCYGLFARAKWGIEPARAVGELHYLLTRQNAIVTLDEMSLAEGVELMRESIRGMRSLLSDPLQNVADEDAFPRVDDPDVCEHCNFRKICWPKWPERFVPTARPALEVVPPQVAC
jgi:CRISPR/Cas system-associated exonuclease Cas4 (RecB family)